MLYTDTKGTYGVVFGRRIYDDELSNRTSEQKENSEKWARLGYQYLELGDESKYRWCLDNAEAGVEYYVPRDFRKLQSKASWLRRAEKYEEANKLIEAMMCRRYAEEGVPYEE